MANTPKFMGILSAVVFLILLIILVFVLYVWVFGSDAAF